MANANGKYFALYMTVMKRILDLGAYRYNLNTPEYRGFRKAVMSIFFNELQRFYNLNSDMFKDCKCGSNGYSQSACECGGSGKLLKSANVQ